MLVCIASFLLFLAVPRFFSSIDALYSDAVIEKISSGESTSQAIYLKAKRHLISAIDWTDSDVYWRQLSFLKFNYFISNLAEDRDVDQSIAELRATSVIALQMMPVAPYTWSDLAVINSMYPETLNSALQAMKMSVYVDRVNPNLLKSRVLFLWKNSPILDDELHTLFKAQLLLLWQLKRYELIQVLKDNPDIESFLFDLLLNSPEDLLEFNKLLVKIRR
ncbi:MAG: hypothetical protein QM500_03660 [Methylococcales bacterium]